MTGGLLDGYDRGGFFDEAIAENGTARPGQDSLVGWFDSLSADDLRYHSTLRDDLLLSRGITFTVYGESQGIERTWPMDLFPRVITAEEWTVLEQGLTQRVNAVNRFLEDLYVGEQSILEDRVVPRWLVMSSTGFEREAFNVTVPNGARCLVSGIDIVRGADGQFLVLEDNLRNPSGVSYVLENRATMARVLTGAFEEMAIRSVDHYGRSLLAALKHVAPPAADDDPIVCVLTPGIYNSAYFEHAFLARQMGVELVEGRDLVVDDHIVAMRTTGGLRKVDVIYRRIDDHFLDPAVFDTGSTVGVPGLMAAVRAGTVTLSNAVGNGVADDKAVYPYVPAMINYYLGEEPILPNATTYVLWDDDQRAAALERADELVWKPVAESGGYGIVIGPSATDEELADVRTTVEADPRGWIAQEVVQLSRVPSCIEGGLEGRHVDLRPFILTGKSIEVLPGGLTRVAMREGSLIVNSSQGGGSKDTWVLDTPADEATG
ncbi:MAG: circularly permuted type 2 ATP-grasp protein [Acidimicrobiales bacterium]|jgi:uncharacterized circularly permuted ATP-grasp superfamily protein|nr:circularly permuted type 2 ATP-grasp protein [Acidimicrobiales bacterium]MDP7117085.1 circularly permuted type 2 ATP-grasp protein [Acidimicrobiales bacterium]